MKQVRLKQYVYIHNYGWLQSLCQNIHDTMQSQANKLVETVDDVIATISVRQSVYITF